MKIILFKEKSIYKKLLEKNEHNREINIYQFQNTSITGHNLYYPNCLLYSQNSLYLPLLEKTMSLNMGTIYDINMIFNDTPKTNRGLNGNYFFFIYNTENYFHFLYDSLPYLISYFELKKEIPDLKLLMQYPPQKNNHYLFVSEMLELIGIHPIEILNSNIEYENVYVSTSYTHDFDSNLPPRKEIYDFYQTLSKKVGDLYKKETPKKIYISRRTHLHNDLSNIGTNYTQRRKLVNEDELVDEFIQEGYVEVFTECLSTIEKIAYFSNATHVIGCIGGGISNVLFSKPNTKLICIVSPTFLDVNTRFKYSLDCVDVYYDFNTVHLEHTKFKKYMRVKKDDIIGEILEVKENSVVIQYSDGSNTGWNSQHSYKTMELEHTSIIALDNGLNSPFIYYA